MKRLLLLAATCVAAVTYTTPASAATITLTSPGVVNGAFDVLVEATDLFDGHNSPDNTLLWAAFDVNVSVPGVLSYLGATTGPLFEPNNASFGPDVYAQALALTGIPMGTPEPLLLATLHFTVIGVGPASIFITGDPSDGVQGLQFLNDLVGAPIEASTSVRAVAPVPEPATLVLSGIGLIAMASLRRLRRNG